MDSSKEKKRLPIITTLIETFGFSPLVASIVAFAIAFVCVAAVVWVIRSAPPRTIYLTSGPEGSSFHRWALRYQKELAAHDIALEVLPSGGSLDNLERLKDPKVKVDFGFVAGGLAKEEDARGLISLGSVAYQPLMVFYRSPTPITRLSELAGKRVAVGAVGSGTRSLATTLLLANGIKGAPTTFVDSDAGAAATALMEGNLDAVFLMGDSAPIQILRTLFRAPDVQLYNFTQADAYVRRNAYLNKISLPQGSIDLATNLPGQNVTLVGPTIELVAHEDLNPAVSDLLLDVAKTVHGSAGLWQKRGEFPAALEHEFPLSDAAIRYYKTGKGFFYRTFKSFWLASLMDRLLLAVVPLVLVLIPAIRYLPVAYRLSIQLRLYRAYRPLLRVEQESFGPLTPERRRELLTRIDEIEDTVNHLKVPASFADRFYWLRSHLISVRQRLERTTTLAG